MAFDFTPAVAPPYIPQGPQPTMGQGPYPYQPGMTPGMPAGMLMGMLGPQASAPGPQQPSNNFSTMGFSNELQQMMAPYRQQAAQMESPYAAFGPNNQFAANHPRAAGVIDNALLAASMTKPSQTVGEAISNVAGGLVGANQWHRQEAIQQQMLPYQLAEPGFNMMGKLSEMQMNQMYKQQMMDYHMGMMGLGQQRVDVSQERLDAPKPIGAAKVGTDNQAYQQVFNPSNNSIEWRNSQNQVVPNPPFAEPGSTSGLTPGHIIQMQQSTDPKIKAQGDAAAKSYIALQGGVAGGQAGNRTQADQPTKDLDAEYGEATKGIPAVPLLKMDDWLKAQSPVAGVPAVKDAKGNQLAPSQIPDAYAKYAQGVNQQNAQTKNQQLSRINQWRNERQQGKTTLGWPDWDVHHSGNNPNIQVLGGPPSGGAKAQAPKAGDPLGLF